MNKTKRNSIAALATVPVTFVTKLFADSHTQVLRDRRHTLRHREAVLRHLSGNEDFSTIISTTAANIRASNNMAAPVQDLFDGVSITLNGIMSGLSLGSIIANQAESTDPVVTEISDKCSCAAAIAAMCNLGMETTRSLYILIATKLTDHQIAAADKKIKAALSTIDHSDWARITADCDAWLAQQRSANQGQFPDMSVEEALETLRPIVDTFDEVAAESDDAAGPDPASGEADVPQPEPITPTAPPAGAVSTRGWNPDEP